MEAETVLEVETEGLEQIEIETVEGIEKRLRQWRKVWRPRVWNKWRARQWK